MSNYGSIVGWLNASQLPGQTDFSGITIRAKQLCIVFPYNTGNITFSHDWNWKAHPTAQRWLLLRANDA